MKVIKRNGRIVDYDRSKVKIAIEKANREVTKKEKATNEDINTIIEYIEELNKKRILVEDIQDIIEEKLMELGRYKLAKKYIVYRYTRALVRKSNTTDESILGLIRQKNKEALKENPNKNEMRASKQRELIAGEVSRDLTKRILLPEKITKACEEGILYFHAADYFAQQILNSCVINIGDMLDNGTTMNGKKIETPKSFQVACIVLTQIITAASSNQYGEQIINVEHLGKYLRKSKQKFEKEIREDFDESKITDEELEKYIDKKLKDELKSGVQIIQYQINTLMTTGHSPNVTLLLQLNIEDEYVKENAMIIEEILNQRYEGIKNTEEDKVDAVYPKLIYVLDQFNCLNGGRYDYITKIAIECSKKNVNLEYISAKKVNENYNNEEKTFDLSKDDEGIYSFEGTFDQGIVSINLPQIGILADKDEEVFWKEFDARLDLCKEALMCRHYALVGTSSEISPIHWKYGAISRLSEDEKIDDLLYEGNSTLSLSFVGLYELTKLMKGEKNLIKEELEFAEKVIKHIKEKTLQWRENTNIGFSICETYVEDVQNKFANIDKQKFGTIEGITDKGYYMNSYHIDKGEQIAPEDKIKIERKFQDISNCGNIVCELKENEIEEFISFAYKNILCFSVKESE